MIVKFVGTSKNEADICTKNLAHVDHECFREQIRNGKMKIWTHHDETVITTPRREDVRKRELASLVHCLVDENDEDSDDEETFFQKKMKISWS